MLHDVSMHSNFKVTLKSDTQSDKDIHARASMVRGTAGVSATLLLDRGAEGRGGPGAARLPRATESQ